MSDRYVTDRYLPDKAIDLIDEAASRVRLKFLVPPDIKSLRKELKELLLKRKKQLILRILKSSQSRDEEQKLKQQLKELRNN